MGVTERGIGLLFLVNTLAVAVLQMPALRVMQGRPRLRVLAAVGPIWAVAWLVVVAAGMWLTGTAALTALLAVVVIFAAGECALPVHTMLVTELAPPELRGRCLALLPASYAVALSLGPALVGVGLSISPYLIWVVSIALLLGAGVVALALERTVPAELGSVRVAAAPQPRRALLQGVRDRFPAEPEAMPSPGSGSPRGFLAGALRGGVG